MQVQVHAQGVDVPDRLRTYVEEKVQEELNHVADRLTRVEVHLRDINGHKGGLDKRCICEARPRGLDPVAAEHDAADVQTAVQGALGKLQRALQHRFERLRDTHR